MMNKYFWKDIKNELSKKKFHPEEQITNSLTILFKRRKIQNYIEDTENCAQLKRMIEGFEKKKKKIWTCQCNEMLTWQCSFTF